MRKSWALLGVVTIAFSGLTAACGDDDGAASADRQDAGPGGRTDSGGGGGDGGRDGGGACTFATYVIGLVQSSTNATAQPDTTLGAGCKDTTDQAEFKPLFP